MPVSPSAWLEAGGSDQSIGGSEQESKYLCSSFSSHPAAFARSAWPMSQLEHTAGRRTRPKILSVDLQQGCSSM